MRPLILTTLLALFMDKAHCQSQEPTDLRLGFISQKVKGGCKFNLCVKITFEIWIKIHKTFSFVGISALGVTDQDCINRRRGQQLGKSNDNVPWKQLCKEEIQNKRGKTCGERNFTPLANVKSPMASPNEFPWMCVVYKNNVEYLGGCVVVPDNSNNDISKGTTTKVITTSHILKLKGPE